MKIKRLAAACFPLFFLALSPGVFPSPAHAENVFYSATPGGPPDAIRAIRICESIDSTPPEERASRIESAVAAAEKSIARFPEDPRSQFALFCSLGRKLETSKNHLRSLFLVRRAHGAMLRRLPWMLGGDNDRAESLIRRAISLDPAFIPAHRELANLLRAQGRSDEAYMVDVAQATD